MDDFWDDFGFLESGWGYNEVNAFDLFRQYSFGHIAKNIWRLLRSAPKVIVRARSMTKPWPFTDYGPYLDQPIVEIRKAFNIQVLE
ncbi:MAG: hypothetical protein AAF990_27575 [Bacteroidota bacterium]